MKRLRELPGFYIRVLERQRREVICDVGEQASEHEGSIWSA